MALAHPLKCMSSLAYFAMALITSIPALKLTKNKTKPKNKEKLEFLKKKGVCFGFLEAGHTSKGCTRRLTCQKCSLKHPTTLHTLKKEVNTCKHNREKFTTSALVEIDKENGWDGTGAFLDQETLIVF